MKRMKTYLYLGAAIVSEVIATSALKASDGVTRLVPSSLAVVFYALAFWLLAQTLRTLSMGVAYAIWAGVGIVLISIVGLVAYKQTLDWPALLGMGLIIAGVVVVNVFSKSMTH